MCPENVLTKGQVISRPEWPCKNAQWRPEVFRQTVGHLPGQSKIAALVAGLGWPSSRGPTVCQSDRSEGQSEGSTHNCFGIKINFPPL